MAIYYVKNSGSDGLDGLSDGNAWQTVAKVNGATFSAGDSILFNKGDIWREQLVIPSAGSAGNQIIFGAYGSGVNPTFSGSNVITGWAAATSPRYSVAMTTQTYIVFKDGVRAAKGASAGTLNNGEWFWETNVLYFRWDAGNPDAQGLSMEAGQRTNVVWNGKNAVTLQDIIFQHNNGSTSAIYITGTVSIGTISNCTIKDGMSGGIELSSASALQMLNLTITDMNGAGIAIFVEGTGLIDSCTLAGNGWITTANAYGIGGQLGGWTINGCDVSNSGSGGAATQCHGIYVGTPTTTTPVIITNNILRDQTKGAGLRLHGSATATRNKIYNNTGGGVAISCATDTIDATWTLIRNLIYGNASSGVEFSSIGTGAKIAKFYHNVIYTTGTGGNGIGVGSGNNVQMDFRNNIIFTAAATNAFNIGTYGTYTSVVINNNVSWRADDNSYIYRWQGNYPNFAGWQGYGFDTVGTRADPLFRDAANADFTLLSGSPAIDLGVAISGINDGYAGAAPDAGAFETGVTPVMMHHYRELRQ